MAMPDDAPHQPPGDNRLLAALPREDLERLRPQLETVDLAFRERVYKPNEPIPHVYFPVSGVCSVVVGMANGAVVEVATIGNEGMVGLPVFLRSGTVPGEAFSQIAGRHCRLSADALLRETDNGGALHDLLQRYTQALINQIAQSAACNRLHPIEQRCARWLLLTHDRVAGDRFPLTQQFLAQMLGVRRAGVSVAASMLQTAGLIRYARGVMTVTDRAGLEDAACECYDVVRRELDRLLG
jgi:CRP-like cAMP-binding protein